MRNLTDQEIFKLACEEHVNDWFEERCSDEHFMLSAGNGEIPKAERLFQQGKLLFMKTDGHGKILD